jgi:hypothetical protein
MKATLTMWLPASIASKRAKFSGGRKSRRSSWTLDGAHCQLWEIDEDLVRAELTELERAEHCRVRKIVYERIHP